MFIPITLSIILIAFFLFFSLLINISLFISLVTEKNEETASTKLGVAATLSIILTFVFIKSGLFEQSLSFDYFYGAISGFSLWFFMDRKRKRNFNFSRYQKHNNSIEKESEVSAISTSKSVMLILLYVSLGILIVYLLIRLLEFSFRISFPFD